jgi:predicted transcriptional regulator
MAEKSKTREVTITDESGAFNTILKRFRSETPYDFEGLSDLRKLLSNQKAKILHTLKTKKPHSLYKLSKILKRDFKSVSGDIRLLEKFGFVEMIAEKTGKRERLKPILAVDSLHLHIKV